MSTPMMDHLLSHKDTIPWLGIDERMQLAAELSTLLAERDALKAAATPPRRLREYVNSREIAYRWRNGVLEQRNDDGVWQTSFTVDTSDVSALAELRTNPEEPLQTLEGIIEPALTAMYELGWDRHGGSSDMAAEDLAKDIRRAFPSLDARPRALTAGEHIAALRAGGALIQDTIAAYHTNPDRPPRVLVLTPEQWGTP